MRTKLELDRIYKTFECWLPNLNHDTEDYDCEGELDHDFEIEESNEYYISFKVKGRVAYREVADTYEEQGYIDKEEFNKHNISISHIFIVENETDTVVEFSEKSIEYITNKLTEDIT